MIKIVIIVIMMIIMCISTIIGFEKTITTFVATTMPYSTSTLNIIDFVIWKIFLFSYQSRIIFVVVISIGKRYFIIISEMRKGKKGNLMNFLLPLDNDDVDDDDFPFSR